MLGACLCCRKKVPKNELMGLEGMVTLKNPEDLTCTPDSTNIVSANQCKYSEIDTKRASGAPNRSLPDIPIVDQTADQTSDFYAVVVDVSNDNDAEENECVQLPQAQPSLSKQSSISQCDDLGTRYARVQTPSHAYDKVSFQEHPYAQLNSVRSSCNVRSSIDIPPSHSSETRESTPNPSVAYETEPEIPAASAIAGMVSASRELPYMTPPILNTNSHFSGDSQDSTKGYTSISVREPLAIILASRVNLLSQPVKRSLCDSHYTTVSDDSDETYAAIEDSNYVESATYAQIQTSNSARFPVEISHNVLNTCEQMEVEYDSNRSFTRTEIPITAQIHSRQASSSSNASSSGPLGSPKREKRQANSPLPPTPQTKNLPNLSASHSILLDRNCVTSNAETTWDNFIQAESWIKGNAMHQNTYSSKDIEEMYAKVVKKNKFCSSLQNTPGTTEIKSILSYTDVMQPSEIDISNERQVVYEKKDHGYETIPGESANMKISDGYAQIVRNKASEYQPDSSSREQLMPAQTEEIDKSFLDHEAQEPNYETLEPARNKDIMIKYNYDMGSSEADEMTDINGKQHFSSSDLKSQINCSSLSSKNSELHPTYESINYQPVDDPVDSSGSDAIKQLP